MKCKIKIKTFTGDTLSIVLITFIILQNYSLQLKNALYLITFMVGLLLFVFCLTELKINRQVLKMLCFISCCAFFNLLIVGNAGISLILKIWFQYFPAAYYLLVSKNKSQMIWNLFASFIALFIVVTYVSNPNKDYLFYGTGRNYVSFFLLFSIFLYTIFLEQKKKEISGWIPVLYLTMCIYAVGRSGIIIGMLYFALVMMVKILRAEGTGSRPFRILFFAVGMIFLFYLLFMHYDTIVTRYFSRFISSEALNSNYGRAGIYKYYLNLTFANPTNFLLGVDVSTVMEKYTFMHGNLHNTYLQLHSSFGIFGMAFYVIFLMKSFRYLYRTQSYQHSFVLVVFLVKMLFDFVACGYLGDIILLYYLMIPMVADQKNSHSKL